MNLQYSAKRGIVRPVHTAYMCSLMILLQMMNMDYVSKMFKIKDKDLMFIYEPDGFLIELAYIYEISRTPFCAVTVHSVQRILLCGIWDLLEVITE